MRRPLVSLSALVASIMVLTMAEPTSAQDAPTFRDFTRVDFHTPTIVSSNRVIGLGGSFISIAEGADGHLVNPASYAVRYPHAPDDWYDWDWSLSWLNVPSNSNNQVDLAQTEAEYDQVTFATFGVDFKLGHHGFGFQVALQNYDITRPVADGEPPTPNVIYSQQLVQFGYAYAVGNGDLTLGGGTIVGAARFDDDGADPPLISITGGGLHLGVLYGPCTSNYRVGATWRSPIAANQVEEGDVELIGDAVPHELVVPWEFGIGASYMFGQRPYNACPSFGEFDDRDAFYWPWEDDDPGARLYQKYFPRAWPRKYFLVSFDLVFTGPSKDAIGVQSFLQEELERAGAEVSISPRAGVETEVWADVLQLRLGGYYEPSRYDHRAGRPHFTGGADLNLFELYWQWKLTSAVDIAESYLNIGVGVGFWH